MTPDAVRMFRSKTHRFPPKSWYDEIEEVVGDEADDLLFWGNVVYNWVGMGWNPTNVKGMLECYKERAIPGEEKTDRRRYVEGEFADYIRR